MPAKNPRLLNVGQPAPVLIAQVLGATATAITADPGATVDYVIKQVILSNMGTAANVVHLYIDTSTTVSSVERIMETSVPADSTIILYVNIRLSTTKILYGNATVASEVNVTIVGDIEAV
jgi:hypothetical protein